MNTNFVERPIAAKPLEITIAPGQIVPAWIKVKRDGHTDLVSFTVDNLPHGVIVDNIGLSGVLIPKGQDERQIFFSAAKWVGETDRLVHAQAKQAGNPTSLPIWLHVRKPAEQAAANTKGEEVTGFRRLDRPPGSKAGANPRLACAMISVILAATLFQVMATELPASSPLLSRRHFLWNAAGGLGGIALAWMLRPRASPRGGAGRGFVGAPAALRAEGQARRADLLLRRRQPSRHVRLQAGAGEVPRQDARRQRREQRFLRPAGQCDEKPSTNSASTARAARGSAVCCRIWRAAWTTCASSIRWSPRATTTRRPRSR